MIDKAKVIELQSDQAYIHYVDQDRRLDTWIHRSTIIRVTDASSDAALSIADYKTVKTRNMKRKVEEMDFSKLGEIDPKFLALEKEREEITKVRNVETIYLGKYQISTWYFSPFPEEYGKCKDLWICEFCLKYMKWNESFQSHKVSSFNAPLKRVKNEILTFKKSCLKKCPPGYSVYQNDNLKIYQIDGKQEKVVLSCNISYIVNYCVFYLNFF